MDILIIYLIGCLLSFGRVNAFNNYWDDVGVDNDDNNRFLIIVTISSWVGFIAGTISYFKGYEFYSIRMLMNKEKFLDFKINRK